MHNCHATWSANVADVNVPHEKAYTFLVKVRLIQKKKNGLLTLTLVCPVQSLKANDV